MDDTAARCRKLVTGFHDARLISDGCFDSLMKQPVTSKQEALQLIDDLLDAILRRDFYQLLERIERGERMIATETDPQKRAGYEKFKQRLVAELETMTDGVEQ